MNRPAKPRRAGANRVRVIGGAWRSRLIVFPDSEGLRPTPDRVRETLFNWLGQDLGGRRCLDLFAGSGALGFEALSRGAAEVVMVERSRTAARALEENARRLGAHALRIVVDDALHSVAVPAARGLDGRFDVVFLDPPYGSGLAERVLAHVPALLAVGGVVYVEVDAPLAPAPAWRVRKRARAGAVHYYLLEWGGDGDQGSLSGDVRPADARP